MFTWDTASCKHIYDRLIFDLYSYGRSSFLHLNPGREKDAYTIKCKAAVAGMVKIGFNSMSTGKLYLMGYFDVHGFPMRTNYATVSEL
jgi:hypothetical protein